MYHSSQSNFTTRSCSSCLRTSAAVLSKHRVMAEGGAAGHETTYMYQASIPPRDETRRSERNCTWRRQLLSKLGSCQLSHPILVLLSKAVQRFLPTQPPSIIILHRRHYHHPLLATLPTTTPPTSFEIPEVETRIPPRTTSLADTTHNKPLSPSAPLTRPREPVAVLARLSASLCCHG